MFLNGSESSKILNSLFDKIKGKHIPFYAITAYDETTCSFVNSHIKKICAKPLDSYEATKIFIELFENK